MYTSIRRYHTKYSEDLTRRVQEEYLPRVRETPGFLGYYAIRGEGGDWASITVGETRDSVEEANRLAREFVVGEFRELVEGPAEVLVGEVVIQEMRYHEHEQREAA